MKRNFICHLAAKRMRRLSKNFIFATHVARNHRRRLYSKEMLETGKPSNWSFSGQDNVHWLATIPCESSLVDFCARPWCTTCLSPPCSEQHPNSWSFSHLFHPTQISWFTFMVNTNVGSHQHSALSSLSNYWLFLSRRMCLIHPKTPNNKRSG